MQKERKKGVREKKKVGKMRRGQSKGKGIEKKATGKEEEGEEKR